MLKSLVILLLYAVREFSITFIKNISAWFHLISKKSFRKMAMEQEDKDGLVNGMESIKLIQYGEHSCSSGELHLLVIQ